MEDLSKFISVFKEFLSFPIPLGVCVLIAVLLSIAVKFMLNSHDKNFEIAQRQKDTLIEMLMKQDDKAQKRIKRLETMLDKKLGDSMNSKKK